VREQLAPRIDLDAAPWVNHGVLISVEHDVIRLLADPLRARLVELLAGGPACTCHLVTDSGATQSNVSNHLRALRHAGVVVAEPHGRFTYYRLVPEVLEAAAQQLAELAGRARSNADARREC
jgi:ArsR family transcriptional regulator